MSDAAATPPDLAHLPTEMVDRVAEPFARFLRIEAAGGALLLGTTLAAVALANSPWAAAFLGIWEIPAGWTLGAWESARSVRIRLHRMYGPAQRPHAGAHTMRMSVERAGAGFPHDRLHRDT